MWRKLYSASGLFGCYLASNMINIKYRVQLKSGKFIVFISNVHKIPAVGQVEFTGWYPTRVSEYWRGPLPVSEWLDQWTCCLTRFMTPSNLYFVPLFALALGIGHIQWDRHDENRFRLVKSRMRNELVNWQWLAKDFNSVSNVRWRTHSPLLLWASSTDIY